ncbi:MAG: DNA polymerase I [Lachnospira sp.]
MAEKLMLMDGHSILNRAFYGVPDLTNSEGIHTNALFGFLNIMFKFIDEEQPDYIVVAFDVSAPTFRHEMYDEYKGTRKPMVPELKQQVPIMKDILRAMQIKVVEMPGFEADDILGTLSKTGSKNDKEVVIISGDRDLLQLAEDHIKIRIPKTKKGVTEVEDYLPVQVMETYGVTPLEFIDVKALMGDTSDNIPGAPGIGPKTASNLIKEYHCIENIFEHIDEIKPPKAKESIRDNMEQVKLSKILATIKIDVPMDDFSFEDARVKNFYNQESYELFKRYNFKNILKKFDTDYSGSKELDCYEYFKAVHDFGEAEQIFSNALKYAEDNSYIGLCTESEGACFAVALTLSDKEIFYIPAQGFITEEYLKGKLVEISNAAADRKVSFDNLKDSLNVFDSDKENGYPLVTEKKFIDPAIAAYLIHPNNDQYNCETLSVEFLSATIASKDEILNRQTIEMCYLMDEERLMKYMCLRSFINYSVAGKCASKLDELEMYSLFDTIEMPLIFVLYDMQKQGISVNKKELEDYSKVLGEKIEILEKQIYEGAGEEFNINSPKQLGVILFEKLGLPYGKKTKTGYSTAADVLEKLAEENPLVSKILEYRQLTKLKSTYADGLQSFIGEDGRIHSTFNQTITTTGRISSTEPNLQNIPIRMEMGKAIRKVFVPKEGYVFIDADYSQIELRILAHMSGDEKLISAYNKSEDIHRATASEVFGVPLDEVTAEQRRNAKAVNFGIIYGISSFGLSQDLSISAKEAKEYIEKYFATYPSIKSYIDGLVSYAKEHGYSLTMFNRRRDIPEIKSSNFVQRSFGERAAMNAPIQGTAADIIKLAMISVYEKLKEAKLESRLILQVHDELLVETKENEIEQVKRIINDCMRNVVNLKVALEIDLKQGRDWLEAH